MSGCGGATPPWQWTPAQQAAVTGTCSVTNLGGQLELCDREGAACTSTLKTGALTCTHYTNDGQPDLMPTYSVCACD